MHSANSPDPISPLLSLGWNVDTSSLTLSVSLTLAIMLGILILALLALKWWLGGFSFKEFEIDQAEIGVGNNKFRFRPNLSDKQVAYRFHDVFHLAHAAVLHWSPVFRALIKQKRKSESRTDEAQDGGRAIVVEEGLTAWIFGRAKHLDFFEGQERLSFDILKNIQDFVAGYEVEQCPLSLWEQAILQGYDVFRQVKAAKGGWVIGDRTTRTLGYEPLEMDA